MAYSMLFAVLGIYFACTLSSAAVNVPTLPLNDGNHIPALGLGTALGDSNVPPEQSGLFEAISVAIENGYRHIDTATYYGDEHVIGAALKKNFDEGKVKREDMFITTKVPNNHNKPELVEPAIRESLKKLQLDYVDLYLIHWPMSLNADGSFDNTDYVDTWKAVEEVKRKGLARSIGVSNFNEQQLERVLKEGSIKPAVLQIEVNPNLTQLKLVKFAQDRGLVVTGYSPFGSLPSSKRDKDSPPPKWDDPTLTAIGKKYGKTVAQVVLRYLLQRNIVVIPKTVTPSRLKENINVFDFNLLPQEMIQVGGFNRDYRTISVAYAKDHPNYPF